MSFPYNNNIPQPTDALNKSQGDLLTNFGSIKSLIDVNHYDFANTLAGKHMFVTLPIQAADPGTTSTEMALYTKDDGSGSNPAMFIQPKSSGTPINITSSGQATNGWTRLPSGILLKWGAVPGVTVQSGFTITPQVVNFPVSGSIPVFSSVYNVQVTLGANSSSDYNQAIMMPSFTTTTFTVVPRQLSGIVTETVTVYFFAIGI